MESKGASLPNVLIGKSAPSLMAMSPVFVAIELRLERHLAPTCLAYTLFIYKGTEKGIKERAAQQCRTAQCFNCKTLERYYFSSARYLIVRTI